MKHLKVKFLIILTSLCVLTSAKAETASVIENGNEGVTASHASRTALVEVKYDRLMRTFINRLKLAFTEADDANTLAMLNQFSVQFHQQTDGIKQDLATSVKELSREETEALYKRLVEKSRNAELIALIFDERISSRVAKNAEIKAALDALQTKSLELQQADFYALK